MKKIYYFFKRNIKLIIIVLLIMLLLILFPIILDVFIFGNTFYSNITNSDWASFLGGYIGAIVSGVVSLVGIILTIKYTDKQNKEDRELQVRPYCSIRYVPIEKFYKPKNILGIYTTGFEPQKEDGYEVKGILYIKNIGLGAMVNFNYEIELLDSDRKQLLIFPQTTEQIINNYTTCLQINEEGCILIYIKLNFDEITEKDIIEIDDDFCKYHLTEEAFNRYKPFKIRVKLKVYDIFQNEFTQIILLKTSISQELNPNNKSGRYLLDIDLDDVGILKKSKG